MSLRTRLTALAQAIGLDIKNLQSQVSAMVPPYVTYNPWQRFNIAVNTTQLPATYTVGKLNVFYNGKLLRPNGDDYTATNGTTIDFTFTLEPGDEIDVETINISADVSNQAVTIDRRAYTTGLTGVATFNVNYTAPYVRVVVNGFIIPPTDYTATNGTSITLNSPLTADDLSVDLEGFTAFAVANTYTLAQADAKFLTIANATATYLSKTAAGATYIPQDPTATTAKATLDGNEILQADSTGLKKFAVQKILDFLTSKVNSWTAANTFKTISFASQVGVGNSGTAVTVNFANGQKQSLVLTGNATVTLQFPGVGNYQLILTQDGTGNRTVTWAGYAGIYYVGSATAPAINTPANTMTMVSFYFNGASAVWLAASKVNA
jgi:hypothetical protein